METFEPKLKFSIDRGGTFTDVYCEFSEGGKTEIITEKLLSKDPKNYQDAPAEAIRRIVNKKLNINISQSAKIPGKYIDSIRMGTTIATNALLERTGERSALLITKGFRDQVQIGNQARPKIFCLEIVKPEALYEEVIEVEERVLFSPEVTEGSIKGKTGENFTIDTPLNEAQVKEALVSLKAKGINSVAVALIHSYSFQEHELRIKEIAKSIGIPNVSLSHELMSVVKFYPRASTATVDAYLTPAIANYIKNFLSFFEDMPETLFMQSDGGLTSHKNFTGSKAIISGPAGGVVGYSLSAAKETDKPVLGLDMGGTSTDVSRFAGDYEHVFENEVNGIAINCPQIAVETVAAGGGSRLFYENGMFRIGPESAGADPGPVCYRKNGYLAVTDANLVLGRIIPDLFPKIFGPSADEPLDKDGSYNEISKIAQKIGYSTEKAALGFIEVANEAMCRPILNITQTKGFDPKDHVLSVFGGAGGQHCCGIARKLGIDTVYVHKYSGILSAYGLSLSTIIEESTSAVNQVYSVSSIEFATKILEENSQKCLKKLENMLSDSFRLERKNYLLMKFEGNEFDTVVEEPEDKDFKSKFLSIFKREYGFLLENSEVLITSARVKLSLIPLHSENTVSSETVNTVPETDLTVDTVFSIKNEAVTLPTRVFFLDKLHPGQTIEGPSIIMSGSSTILIEPNCSASLSVNNNVIIKVPQEQANTVEISKDPTNLALFGNKFMSIAEQMGKHLERTAVSVNIKERLDFSCAIFDSTGNLVANAPHLPVHLGAMQEAVKSQISFYNGAIPEGTSILSNHPEMGGSHLPDLTVITPVYVKGRPAFYLANRGHHSDIGGLTPGSMPPFSKNIFEEGVAVKSFKLVENDVFDEEGLKKLFVDDMESKGLKGSRRLADNLSDLKAQVASNKKGDKLMKDLCNQYSVEVVSAYMQFIQDAAEEAVRNMLKRFCKENNINSNEVVIEEDFMDDGSKIKLTVNIDQSTGEGTFDFGDTSSQVLGNTNAPKAVVYSAIIYCMRSMVDMEIPLNQGCMKPIRVEVPKSSLLWPDFECAVVGGNVLTSQRVTDIVLRAFGALSNSQGCMNNLTFGNDSLSYYETIGGGSGAGEGFHGKSGVQVHMTNTRITDVEVLERKFPVKLCKFAYRTGSGGKGLFCGGDGLVREFKFLKPLNLSILSERRVFSPKGTKGGKDGQKGVNTYVKANGARFNVGGKATLTMEKNELFIVETPGGGGFK